MDVRAVVARASRVCWAATGALLTMAYVVVAASGATYHSGAQRILIV
jgi:hypothetical protein